MSDVTFTHDGVEYVAEYTRPARGRFSDIEVQSVKSDDGQRVFLDTAKQQNALWDAARTAAIDAEMESQSSEARY